MDRTIRECKSIDQEFGVANGAFEGDSPPIGHKVGHVNASFVPDVETTTPTVDISQLQAVEEGKGVQDRQTWANPVEFLLSCISMSVGLGNVWRFPKVAFKNGGGAFLIPYLVVLFFIGKPLYFLEMAIGQFSSYGPVKVWQAAPILKGVGYGNTVANGLITTYYTVLIAISIFYFFASFQSVLPWTVCDPSWKSFDSCYSTSSNETAAGSNLTSSSAIYFKEEVMKSWDNIDHGIGLPDWRLSLCLLLAWICICLILMKGVASSGKAAYFTAIFPYVVLITLLIRGATLPGATDGMWYFIKPDWAKLLDPNTWYEAVTQCFFSLGVGFGPIIMFSSYNPFRHNIYRDAMIISGMDTFTSLLGGFTIFSILGNLAYETHRNVSDVVEGGPGLAFVSYPEAIGKFTFVPQLFAVLFFLMLFTLGIGSAVSLTGGVVTTVCDAMPNLKRWLVTVVVCVIGFFAGLVYVTPGGLFILDIVDYFAGGFIMYVISIIGTIGICWIYGLNRFVRDVEFMLGIKLSAYWKVTWAYIIPVSLLGIFIYAMATYSPKEIGAGPYPPAALAVGWILTAIALLQVPLWAVHVIIKGMGITWSQVLEHARNGFQTHDKWGPRSADERHNWQNFTAQNFTQGSGRLWFPKIPSQVKIVLAKPFSRFRN